MLQLRENEKIAIVVRKHWFVIANRLSLFLFLLIVPIAALPAFSGLFSVVGINPTMAAPFVHFFLSIYIMTLLAGVYFFFMDYCLDSWIVTNQRILDIEQHGLFSREISEIPINRVQDITIEVRGFFRTIFKFGTIRLQTAGEREYTIDNIPHLHEIKDAILRYTHPDTAPTSNNSSSQQQPPPSSQIPGKGV